VGQARPERGSSMANRGEEHSPNWLCSRSLSPAPPETGHWSSPPRHRHVSLMVIAVAYRFAEYQQEGPTGWCCDERSGMVRRSEERAD
jgi:hypothetical protein